MKNWNDHSESYWGYQKQEREGLSSSDDEMCCWTKVEIMVVEVDLGADSLEEEQMREH